MVFETEVEVLSVTQATDVTTGDLMYQVGLGRIGKPMTGLQTPPQMKKISSNTMIIFMPLGGECPYVVGSKWTLIIANNGSLNLKRLRGKK